MSATAILHELRQMGNPADAAGMKRFAIGSGEVLGIKIPRLRALAKAIGKDSAFARELWTSNVHEARLLAILLLDGKHADESLVEAWLHDLASWDTCDQLCLALAKWPQAFPKAMEWSHHREEFRKRAGFALMAVLAVHAKKEPDSSFLPFLTRIEAEAGDDRNFVKKAVNWALRQIGKRSDDLHREAVTTAHRIAAQGSRSARWIASDALRELAAPRRRQAQSKAGQ